jgi:hypothetical protein
MPAISTYKVQFYQKKHVKIRLKIDMLLLVLKHGDERFIE